MPCPGWYYCENAAVTGISQPYGFPPGLNVNLSGSFRKGTGLMPSFIYGFAFPIGKACPLMDMVGYCAFLNTFSASAGTSLST